MWGRQERASPPGTGVFVADDPAGGGTDGRPPDRPGGRVELVGLTKRYGDQPAVDGIDLVIEPGEFFSLLGPSGCGKTTTLRMIAGFEEPDAGAVRIDGVDMSRVAAHRRPVNTVFQSYALFPHLDVVGNVSYGLRWRKDLSKGERARRVADAISLVRLDGLEHRRPAQLSGGQQQRVALARALVLRPAVLLLDEPLGALDAKLRKALQGELAALQREVGITFCYVTHDQEEALTMSDRLAVMDRGRVVGIGSPRDVYEEPPNAFVADFLGVANLLHLDGAVPTAEGEWRVRLGAFHLRVRGPSPTASPARLVVRPECVRLLPPPCEGENVVPAIVDEVVYVGAVTTVVARLPGGATVQALVANREPHPWRVGMPVAVQLPAERLRLV
jgi:spermidine/putrescine transport system ATP-binding protein